MSATHVGETEAGMMRRGIMRIVVVVALLSSLFGMTAASAMASTDASPHPSALPVQSVRTVNYGWSGQEYYFSRDESKDIAAGGGFLVGWRIGGPVLGTMIAMASQENQNAVDNGQCLRMRTWGVYSAFSTWSVYSC